MYKRLLMRVLVWRLKHVSDNNFILIVAGIVGLVAGLAAVTLKSSVHVIQDLLARNLDFTGVNYLYLSYPLLG
ncbi:MAG: CIC family chloride channel protein, partial [Cyclobacteriaceae bacterium]